MKILQVGKFYPIRGGVEKVMYDLMEGLSGRNIRCDMLCAVTEQQKPGIIPLNDYAQLLCMTVWMKLYATMISPAMILKLRKLRHEYDIVHIHHPDPMACLALFLSGYKGKVVLHWHSDILKQKMLLRIYKPLQKWLIKRADVIVGTTPVYVRQSPFLKHVQDKTTYIPIGINELDIESDSATSIKNQYSGRKIIFSLGRLVEYKGYEYLIEAAKYLNDDYIVLIGGDGHLKGKLEQQIEELKVGEKVKLLGFVADNKEIAAYYSACDVFCISSIWKTEAFGIVQIEAMSCGKPVIATRIAESGVSWVNDDGVSGFNVEPQNAEALAEAIKRIVSDSQLYSQLSASARQRYETMFTREKMVDKCAGLYHDVLGKTISLPNQSFFTEVKALLDEGKCVRIPVKGSSMRPFLQNGDTVELLSVSGRKIHWGEIVLACTQKGHIVLHRVVFKKKDRLWLMGDAHSRQKEQITVGDVWAFSATAYRKGKMRKLDSFGMCCAVVCWFIAMPFRRLLLKIVDRLK